MVNIWERATQFGTYLASDLMPLQREGSIAGVQRKYNIILLLGGSQPLSHCTEPHPQPQSSQRGTQPYLCS